MRFRLRRRPRPEGPRVTLLGREHCHLCVDARAVVEEVTRQVGEQFVHLDVDDDPVLRERYGDLVPVVLVDGVELAHYRVAPEQLRRALR